MKNEQRGGHKDHHTLKRALHIGLLSLAMIGFFGLPMKNINNTERVVAALWSGEAVDCTTGNPQTRNTPFQAILVPGSKVYFDETDGTYKPDRFQARRDEAAALAYVAGIVEMYRPGGPPVIYLLDGDRGPGIQTDISVQDVQKRVEALSHGTITLPKEAFAVETKSKNTATNMREAKNILDHFGIDNAVVITDDFHLLRATLYACANNIHASGLSVEQLTAWFDPTHINEVDAPNQTPAMKLRRLKEFLEVVESIFDDKGYIPTLIK